MVKNDVYIYINEINFSKINKVYTNLIVFDDLVFSDKRISEFFTKSRKINSSCIFYLIDIFALIDKLVIT